jgi:plastocyanin
MAFRARMSSFVAALVVALAAVASVPSPARPHPRPAATAVGVGEREFRLAVYRTTAPAGVVRFDVANYGEDKHDFVVRDRRGREVATSGALRSGRRVVVSARLGPGTYRLRCEIADHARRGMRATIRVAR